jgi:hypothetical protein
VAKKWHEDEPKRPRYYAGDDADAYWYSATDTYVAAALQHCRRAAQALSSVPFRFQPGGQEFAAHIERMLDLYPGLWQGIGEVFTRHDDLTALTSGDTPRANNEAMTRIYHLAAERDLPVLLHSNITSKRERNPLYLAKSKSRCAIIRTRGLSGRMPAAAWRYTATRRRWTFCCRC